MRRILALFIASVTSLASAQPVFSHPDRVRYDGSCFTLDGKDTFVFSGAFHYYRCPKPLWRERFRRIKDAGFNTVETYVPWNWHERDKPKGLQDYSRVDLKDLDDWLTMAEREFGLYTIVRPGPYICAEWASGGFPNWLVAFRPEKPLRDPWFRSDDPVFNAWCRHWFLAVAKVVANHQLSRKPKGEKGVILWQVENEYDFPGFSDDVKREHLRSLIKAAREGGIDVPVFGCWTRPFRTAKGDPILSQGFDTPNEYPRWNIENVGWDLKAQHDAQPWAPKMVTELQGGWFGSVGGLAAEEQDGISASQINALTLYAIQSGITSINYYMLFGGTNFGDWAAKGITTSYDYFAPIREWGGVGEKFRAVKAIGRMLERYGSDLARATEAPLPFAFDKKLVEVGARLGKSGATYLFVRSANRTTAVSGILGGVLQYALGPFGMNVYRYSTDIAKGEWIVRSDPKPVVTALPKPIRLSKAEVSVCQPTGWRSAPMNGTILNLGIYDSRFLFYRAVIPAEKQGYLWLSSKGGDLFSDLGGTPSVRQGGVAWPARPGTMSFVLFNPGWPNGGSGMEQQYGVSEARLVDRLPVGATLLNWKAKVVPNDRDRSLVGDGIDTTGWQDLTPGGFQGIFAENTAVVVRTNYDASPTPDRKSVITFEGIDDESWIYVNGRFVGETHQWNSPFTFSVGEFLRPGSNSIAMVIKNNAGSGGLTGAVAIEGPMPEGEPLDLQWTDRLQAGSPQSYDLETTLPMARFAHPEMKGPRPAGGHMIVRSQIRFAVPKAPGVAWEMIVEAGGDGFLTLNGHALGRYWEVGPQRGFFLPSCWLESENELELTAIPGRLGDRIKAAELRALPMEE